MVRMARERLEDATGKLVPDPHANRLLPLIARGAAQRSTLAAPALERRHARAADRRAFLHPAERPDVEPQSAAFFTVLAEGEVLAQGRLMCSPPPAGSTRRGRRPTSRSRTVERLSGAQSFSVERRGILPGWPGERRCRC
ncbi:hypothetical protein [Streptomyces mirabilis]